MRVIDVLGNIVLQESILVVMLVVFWVLSAETHLRPLLRLVMFFAAGTAVLEAPLALGIRIGHWNWVGKICSVALSLVAIRLTRLSKQEVGLRLPETSREWRVSIAGAVFCVGYVVAYLLLSGTNFANASVEDYAFQATMPGLDEELAFRGIEMALIARAFPRLAYGMPPWLAPLVVVSVLFSTVHALNVENGSISWDFWNGVIFVAPIGCALGCVRIWSGSLLGALFSHNMTNVVSKITTTLLQRNARSSSL